MDKQGYKAYLQSLGDQKYYIGRIHELLELEQKLNIDFDDYIPYNEDYSKCDMLDSLLQEAKIDYEKVFYIINSYMCYRLSGFDKDKEAETTLDSEVVCDEYFSFNGTKNELETKLSTFMSKEDCRSFIDGLRDYRQYLESDECIEIITSHHRPEPGMMYMLIDSSDYNINIKALTIMTIALLLDIKLTFGFASATLSILGFNGQAIVRVNVLEAEKCLILEAMQSKNRIINEDVFSMCNSECVHNNLNCKYQDGDKCTIKKDDITSILYGLCEKNVFKKINDLYKYCL